MPSILLELGFLSNKEDEKLLLDRDWRKKVAELLTDAVKRYRASRSSRTAADGAVTKM